MNAPTYLVAQNVHGPRFTIPLDSGLGPELIFLSFLPSSNALSWSCAIGHIAFGRSTWGSRTPILGWGWCWKEAGRYRPLQSRRSRVYFLQISIQYLPFPVVRIKQTMFEIQINGFVEHFFKASFHIINMLQSNCILRPSQRVTFLMGSQWRTTTSCFGLTSSKSSIHFFKYACNVKSHFLCDVMGAVWKIQGIVIWEWYLILFLMFVRLSLYSLHTFLKIYFNNPVSFLYISLSHALTASVLPSEYRSQMTNPSIFQNLHITSPFCAACIFKHHISLNVRSNIRTASRGLK